MNAKKLRNIKVNKLTVGELRKMLDGVDDDLEVVIACFRKESPSDYCYLADVHTFLKYDPVLKERLYDSQVVELVGYDHEYCEYMEKKDEK